MDAFCLRSFTVPAHGGSSSPSIPGSPDDFVRHVNAVYEAGECPLRDGYAPFCKHLFIPNHLDVHCAYAPITEDNRHLLQSDTDITRCDERCSESDELMRWPLPALCPGPSTSPALRRSWQC